MKELQSSVAKEGCCHKLECTVKGNPLPTVQWYKNDINIDNSPDYVITFNNGEAVLKFEEVFLEDRASYACKATNQWGQSSTTALLDVKRKSHVNVKCLNNYVCWRWRVKISIDFLLIYININFSRANFDKETIFRGIVIKCYG